MQRAAANRPVEKFETEVTLPEWILETDEEAYLGELGNGVDETLDGLSDVGPVADEEAEYQRVIYEATRRDAQPIRRAAPQPSRPNQ